MVAQGMCSWFSSDALSSLFLQAKLKQLLVAIVSENEQEDSTGSR